jgi:hypothetical protein
MAKRPAVHTVRDPEGGWINRTEGSERGFGRAPTKSEAEQVGRESARRRGTEQISHLRNGRFGERRSYGNDPFPPEG